MLPVVTTSATMAPTIGPSWKPWGREAEGVPHALRCRAGADDRNVIGHHAFDAGPGADDMRTGHAREDLHRGARVEGELAVVEHRAVGAYMSGYTARQLQGALVLSHSGAEMLRFELQMLEQYSPIAQTLEACKASELLIEPEWQRALRSIGDDSLAGC